MQILDRLTTMSVGRNNAKNHPNAKKRIGRSPDVADALVLLMAGDAIASRSGSYARDWKQPLVRDIKGVV